MKYIASFIFLISLLPFLTVDARSEGLHPTIEERKIDNYEVRNAMPTLEPANPTIPGGEARNPRDEQTPRDRQAVLCDPKFGGNPSDPGCQKPNPLPTPYDPGDPGNGGGQGGDNSQSGSGSPSSSSSSSSGGGSSSGGVVLGLPKTSSQSLPLNVFIGIICLVKGLSLTIKSLNI